MKKLMLLMFVIGSLLISDANHAQLKTYRFEQIDSLQRAEKRNIVVFIHTDWCRYCQAMKKTTFQSNAVISMLNNNFYFIDLNAEEKKTIIYQGRKFEFKPTGNQTGIHELAQELATIDNQVIYPTLCLSNDKNEILNQQKGFINAKELLQYLASIKN